jgi:hypothetical protein
VGGATGGRGVCTRAAGWSRPAGPPPATAGVHGVVSPGWGGIGCARDLDVAAPGSGLLSGAGFAADGWRASVTWPAASRADGSPFVSAGLPTFTGGPAFTDGPAFAGIPGFALDPSCAAGPACAVDPDWRVDPACAVVSDGALVSDGAV